MGSAGKT
ncbi:hypothetical protein YPPY66_4972, partial [Yersinia pestis PY-66]